MLRPSRLVHGIWSVLSMACVGFLAAPGYAARSMSIANASIAHYQNNTDKVSGNGNYSLEAGDVVQYVYMLKGDSELIGGSVMGSGAWNATSDAHAHASGTFPIGARLYFTSDSVLSSIDTSTRIDVTH